MDLLAIIMTSIINQTVFLLLDGTMSVNIGIRFFVMAVCLIVEPDL